MQQPVQRKYPCVYMRGGTSKAVLFHKKDLPEDPALWPPLFLRVMGSPDVKQIDGMGGTVSSTSKVAVISPSGRDGIDVDYHFFQVDIGQPHVDTRINCGNISSAVGPFAIDEGLVAVVEPVTVVRIYNVNTGKVIESHVRVVNGRAGVEGTAVIQGVPGTGSPIDLYFERPGGAATGKLFPTGNKRETWEVPGVGAVDVTLIDCANPVVFLRAERLGLSGAELAGLGEGVMERLERIRCMAAWKLGFVSHWEDARTRSASAPKIVLVSPAQDYTSLDGKAVRADQMDVCCRAISLGSVHKAYPMTLAVGTAAAAKIEGTLVHEAARADAPGGRVVIGHTSGATAVRVELDGEDVVKAGVVRTARRIMDGFVYVREMEQEGSL